jgi:hypothetical protein
MCCFPACYIRLIFNFSGNYFFFIVTFFDFMYLLIETLETENQQNKKQPKNLSHENYRMHPGTEQPEQI